MLKEKLLGVCKKISFQNLKEIRFKKHAKLFLGLFALIAIGLAWPGGLVHALNVGNAVGDLILGAAYIVIYIVFMVLFWVAYLVAWIGAHILNLSLNPAIMNQVFSNPAIYDGWKIIRDVCNLLFLLLMLLVAFGTIIQSQKYNVKNSLLKLILAIFLINFSNVIAGAIIDFGNILMYGILAWMCPASSTTCFQNLAEPLMRVVDDFNETYSLSNAAITGVGAQQGIGIAVATIYTFMYGFILLALAAFLLVRTAGLAILLILAPFAYFGEVMPGMESISKKWWSSIWKYTLFGPVFALMLYISSNLVKITISVPPISNPALGAYGTLMSTIITNIIPLLFLLAIIPVTKELGLAGTDTIMKNTAGLGEKIGKGTLKYAGGSVDRALARGAGDERKNWKGKLRRGLSNFSPGAWKRAAKTHTASKEHDYDIATGQHRNIIARSDDWRLRKPKTDYKQKALDAKDRADLAEESGDSESEVRARIAADSAGGAVVKSHKLNMLRAKKLAAMNGTIAMLTDLGTAGANDAEKLQNFVRSITPDVNKQEQLYDEMNKAEKANHFYDFEGGIDKAAFGAARFRSAPDQEIARRDYVQGLSPGARQNAKGIGRNIAERRKVLEDARKTLLDAQNKRIAAVAAQADALAADTAASTDATKAALASANSALAGAQAAEIAATTAEGTAATDDLLTT